MHLQRRSYSTPTSFLLFALSLSFASVVACANPTPEDLTRQLYDKELDAAKVMPANSPNSSGTMPALPPIDAQDVSDFKEIFKPIVTKAMQNPEMMEAARDWLGLPVPQAMIDSAKSKQADPNNEANDVPMTDQIKRKSKSIFSRVFNAKGVLQSYRIVSTVPDGNTQVVLVRVTRLVEQKPLVVYEVVPFEKNNNGVWQTTQN